MFRFINYEKPGRGVDPNAPKKKPFFLFFELYFRKFFLLLQVNVLFLLFSLPIVTIGPAKAAMTFILREFSEERHVFLASEFWKAFKENFGKGFLVGLINAVLWMLLIFDGLIVYSRPSVITMILLGLLGLIAIVFAMMQLYLFPLMVEVPQARVLDLFKNAFLLAMSKIYLNVFVLAAILLLYWAIYNIPFLTLFLLAFLHFATVGFISTFYANRVLKKYRLI